MSDIKLKIVRILTCPNCKDYRVCTACSKNPKHQPQIVEIYDLPRLIRHAECGNPDKPCCALFSCSRVGCEKTMFRIIAIARQKKRQFCSTDCRDIIHSAEQKTRVMIPCANCGDPVSRKSYLMKTFKNAFCKLICFKEYRVKQKYGKNEKQKEEEDLARQMSVCNSPRHRGLVTEHIRIKGNLYGCMEGTEKDSSSCGQQKQIFPSLNYGRTRSMVCS